MKTILLTIFTIITLSCQSKSSSKEIVKIPTTMTKSEKAIFAGGCFWCTEAIFLELKGVISIKPGYIGGKKANPSYEEVCTGNTGHAEAIEIVYNPSEISYVELLEVFFETHDPTTMNRQGADVGSQYRSEVFATTNAQFDLAKKYIETLNGENIFGKKVVTKVSMAPTFYIAEDYHQNYYNQNKDKSYCSYVITPKLDKVREKFKKYLKK
jgi:peptide-methionine (S)-S-oxide reductase